jgi:hypothetical protein
MSTCRKRSSIKNKCSRGFRKKIYEIAVTGMGNKF